MNYLEKLQRKYVGKTFPVLNTTIDGKSIIDHVIISNNKFMVTVDKNNEIIIEPEDTLKITRMKHLPT